jgi:DHA1 family bicyclomycin/chloramphenicol resistance-like MFS transporter
MGTGAFTSAMVSFLNNGTPLPMTGVMMTCAIASFTVLIIATRSIRNRPSVEEAEKESAEMMVTS